MPFELSKDRALNLAKALEIAHEKRAELAELIETFNTKMSALFAPVAAGRDGYNAATEIIQDIVGEQLDAWGAEWDAKSQRWQESERGEEVQTMMEEWADYVDAIEGVEVEEPEPATEPEYPELELPTAKEPSGGEADGVDDGDAEAT